MEKNNKYRLTFLKGENVNSIAFHHQRDYFQNMNPYDRFVRKYDTRNIGSFFYDNIPIKFVCKIQTILNEIYDHPFFPFFMTDIWYIAICKKEYENGLPHTLGKVIVLPDNIFQYPNVLFRNTLLHERIHTLQKKYPAQFNTLYTDFWGYREVNPLSIPSSLLQQVRSNPDTMTWWAIRQHIPMVIYNPNPTSIHDTTNVLVTMTSPPHVYNQESIQWYQEMISGRPGCYQPEETSAVILAAFWEQFLNLNKITIQSALEENLKIWIEKTV
jgi:hypothetical protein